MKNETEDLNKAIIQLNLKRDQEFEELIDQFKTTKESLKPLNLLKYSVQKISSTTNIKQGILNTSISLATGYISKKIIIGNSTNTSRKILGTILQIGLSSFLLKILSKRAYKDN